MCMTLGRAPSLPRLLYKPDLDIPRVLSQVFPTIAWMDLLYREPLKLPDIVLRLANLRTGSAVALTAFLLYALKALRGKKSVDTASKIQNSDKYDVIVVGGGMPGSVQYSSLHADQVAIKVLQDVSLQLV